MNYLILRFQAMRLAASDQVTLTDNPVLSLKRLDEQAITYRNLIPWLDGYKIHRQFLAAQLLECCFRSKPAQRKACGQKTHNKTVA